MSEVDSVWRHRLTEIVFVAGLVVITYQIIHGSYASAVMFYLAFSFLLAMTGYHFMAILVWPMMGAIFLLFWANGTWHTRSEDRERQLNRPSRPLD